MALLLLALQGRTSRPQGPGAAPQDQHHGTGMRLLLPFLLAVAGAAPGASGSWGRAVAHRGSPGGAQEGMAPERGTQGLRVLRNQHKSPQARICSPWECPGAHQVRSPNHLYPSMVKASPKGVPKAPQECPLLTSPPTASSVGRKRRRWPRWRTLSQQSLSWQDKPHVRGGDRDQTRRTRPHPQPSGGTRPHPRPAQAPTSPSCCPEVASWRTQWGSGCHWPFFRSPKEGRDALVSPLHIAHRIPMPPFPSTASPGMAASARPSVRTCPGWHQQNGPEA